MKAAYRFLAPGAVVVTGVVLLLWSWGKWPDMMIDFGRELYVPWQLASGKLLYVDIAYFHGPLTPYFNAAIFAMTGPGFLYLVIANLALLALYTACTYRVLDRMAGPLTAATGCIVFLTTFAFAHVLTYGNCNFVTPYSHEMTHGSILALLALMLAWRWLETGRPGWLAGCGGILGALFLTKPEFLIAAGSAVVLAVVVHAWADRSPATAARSLAIVFATAVGVVAVAAMVLAAAVGPGTAVRGVLGSWPDLVNPALREQHFYRVGMGTLDVGASVRALTEWLVRYAGIVAVGVGAAWLFRRAERTRLAGSVVLALGVAVALWSFRERIPWSSVATPLPVVMLIIAGVLAYRVLRAGRQSETIARDVAAMMFTVYAGALLLKMALNTRFHHYGFALAIPATMIGIVVLVSVIPRHLAERGMSGEAFRGVVLGGIAATVAVFLGATATNYASKTERVATGVDSYRADARAEVVNRTLDRIRTIAGPTSTLGVLPEGVMLNYLARVENPTPYINFMPPELIIYGEFRVLDAYRQSPPDYIILTNRSARDYGYRVMGRGYGEALMAWVQANYRLRETIETSIPSRKGDEFTYLLWLERNPG